MSNASLYEKIKEQIRTDLLQEQTADGEVRIPSERELQERYGVSRPTISKALTALAGEGFLVKHQRKGAFILDAAQMGKETAATVRQIGYVAPIAAEELVQRVFKGIDLVAHRHNYRVVMGNAGNDPEREQAAVSEFIASGVCGVIVTPSPRKRAELFTDYLRAENSGVPFVLLDTCLPEQGKIQIVFDNQRAGYDMTVHLLKQGHARIGVATYPQELAHRPLEERLQGYRKALQDYGFRSDRTLVGRFDSSLDHASAMLNILEGWWALSEPPTAIIAADDITALELIELLMLQGRQVPEDITVVGFDNRTVARRFQPPFATTNPNFERMGEIACDLLIDAIENKNTAPRTQILDVPLLIRDSYPRLMAGGEVAVVNDPAVEPVA